MRKSFPNSSSNSPLPQQTSAQTLANIDNNELITSYIHSSSAKSSSTPIQKDDKSLWVPDEKADICYECGNKFILVIRRKHHCRICGRIYCDDCCMKIPNENDNSELRVCNSCYKINAKSGKGYCKHSYVEPQMSNV